MATKIERLRKERDESWRIRIAAGEIKRLRAALKRMNRQLQAAQK